MKGLEFMVIPIGWGENDPGYNYFGYEFGTYDCKDRPRQWMRFPMMCILIKHPTAGYILYDVGCGPREEIDRRPEIHRNMNPAFIERGEYIDERLKQIGLTVNDISAIVISHCHWDHFGGLEFFKGTRALKNVYVNQKDFALGLVNSHKTSKGYSDTVYYKVNFEVEGVEYQLLDEDVELFPGVELIMLEGHTPGTIGLILHLESGSYIFPNDEIACSLNYYDPVVRPGYVYDSLGFARTVKRVRKLERELNGTVMFHHDPWKFPEYKTIPEWYQ